MRLISAKKVGVKPCFCISTDTGSYETNGLTNHNSVAVQNIIMHSLAHRDKIRLGLVDIKQTEFSAYKGTEGVVGVATTIQEAVELLRIAKLVTYKRNKELAKLGIKNVIDYQPTTKTGKVYISGREYGESDLIKARIDNEERTITAGELVELLKTTPV